MKKYSFLWVTGAIFLVTLAAHWWLGWQAYASQAMQHGQSPDLGGFLVEIGRDTFENWQSEFLQLCWQVAALSFLYYAGSPQSRGMTSAWRRSWMPCCVSWTPRPRNGSSRNWIAAIRDLRAGALAWRGASWRRELPLAAERQAIADRQEHHGDPRVAMDGGVQLAQGGSLV